MLIIAPPLHGQNQICHALLLFGAKTNHFDLTIRINDQNFCYKIAYQEQTEIIINTLYLNYGVNEGCHFKNLRLCIKVGIATIKIPNKNKNSVTIIAAL